MKLDVGLHEFGTQTRMHHSHKMDSGWAHRWPFL